MQPIKGKRFARQQLPRQMRLSSDGRVLAARLDAGRKSGPYEASRFIMAYFHNKGFSCDTLQAMRGLNGVGRPPAVLLARWARNREKHKVWEKLP